MQLEVDLKKQIRPNDLAIRAARKRQSAKTRFVHGTADDPTSFDLISIYENFCFVMALFEKRTGDDIEEAKELISKLLNFQTQEGNFPIFLHDFPNCFDPHLRLKIAPFICRILKDFKQVLSCELKDRLKMQLDRMLEFSKELSPLWQFRKEVCLGKNPVKPQLENASLQELWEYWISLEFLETPKTSLFHPKLRIYSGNPSKIAQEEQNIAPQLLEWMIDPDNRKDHPQMIFLSALKGLQEDPFIGDEWLAKNEDSALLLLSPTNQEKVAAKFLWEGDCRIHSLVFDKSATAKKIENGFEVLDRLANPCPISRTDLFETAFYVDADPELDLTIEGVKGTVFYLGQQIWIRSKTRHIRIECQIKQGSGRFVGHIFKGNRSQQIKKEMGEAFDWKIAIRTNQRSDDCALLWKVFCE